MPPPSVLPRARNSILVSQSPHLRPSRPLPSCLRSARPASDLHAGFPTRNRLRLTCIPREKHSRRWDSKAPWLERMPSSRASEKARQRPGKRFKSSHLPNKQHHWDMRLRLRSQAKMFILRYLVKTGTGPCLFYSPFSKQKTSHRSAVCCRKSGLAPFILLVITRHEQSFSPKRHTTQSDKG